MKTIILNFKTLIIVTLASWISTYGQNNNLLKITERDPESANKTVTIEELNKISPYKGDYISLDFIHSLQITNHHISVKISNSNGKDVKLKLHSEPAERYKEQKSQTIIDTTFNIPFADYEKAVKLFKNISSSDIIDGNSNGGLVADGTWCKIQFGYTTNSITYSVWTPDSNTKERKLNQFLECFEYLQKLSKMKF